MTFHLEPHVVCTDAFTVFGAWKSSLKRRYSHTQACNPSSKTHRNPILVDLRLCYCDLRNARNPDTGARRGRGSKPLVVSDMLLPPFLLGVSWCVDRNFLFLLRFPHSSAGAPRRSDCRRRSKRWQALLDYETLTCRMIIRPSHSSNREHGNYAHTKTKLVQTTSVLDRSS